MSGICLVAGLLIAQLGNEVTLVWAHSIEKIRWEEDYRLERGALRLVEARVRGTGAGMEPPAGARLHDGAWHYTPSLPLLPRVLLTHSPYVPDYIACSSGECKSLTAWLSGLPEQGVVELVPCAGE